MTPTRVAVLTPTGTGAIATIAVAGPTAWGVVRGQFRRPGGKPLPEVPPPRRFWFGTLGEGAGDEVVVAVKAADPEPWVEVHCHGGRRVVRWLVEQFRDAGCVEATWQELESARDPGGCDPRALEPLTGAPTLRTASVLLDQYHGAFARAAEVVLADPDGTGHQLAALARFAPVGRHLVAPWKVTIAGAPNVGKSSLINALAGYQRSVVAPVPGTTRDIVTALVAFDGWPVELSDTAGLRGTADPLEAEGVGRARAALAGSDLVVWVLDATDPNPVRPDDGLAPLVVVNKTDQPFGWDIAGAPGLLHVSAATGAGLPELIAAVVGALVPAAPPPGAAVPFTPALAGAVERAHQLVTAGNLAAAREALAACLFGPPDAA